MKNILTLWCIVWAQVFWAQSGWKSYFSYNHIKDIAVHNDRYFIATDNAIFIHNKAETQTFNTINGFKLNKITSIAYSPQYQKIIAANEEGKVAILDINSGKTSMLYNIYNKSDITGNEKKINDVYIHNHTVYLSTGFAICTIDLTTRSFADSFFIGNNGNSVNVLNTFILNGHLYANTSTEGIKRAPLNAMLFDYNSWSIYNSHLWKGLSPHSGELIGINHNNEVCKINEQTVTVLEGLYGEYQSLNTFSNHISTFATDKAIYVYNHFGRVRHLYLNDDWGKITTAHFSGEIIIAGTEKKGAVLQQEHNIVHLSPDGALSNDVFQTRVQGDYLWIIYGGYDGNFNPYGKGLTQYGISQTNLKTKEWKHIPYSIIEPFAATSSIGIHPKQSNVVYVSSYFNGMLKIDFLNGIENPTLTRYNKNNTHYVYTQPNEQIDIRVNGFAYDKDGNIFTLNNNSSKPLNKLGIDNHWSSYKISTLETENKESFTHPIIDKNGTIWAGSFKGAFGVNIAQNKYIKVTNLPQHTTTFTLALDNNHQLWIGTYYGVRVINSIDTALKNGEIKANPIIIMEDGLPQELFFQQKIHKIKVDGANNKWISVADAGVFLLSNDGQKVLKRFDKDNSPLPNNNVVDIEINDHTGEVFFATANGLVSYQGYATQGANHLEEVMVYPNPLRPTDNNEINISKLTDGSTVKITDIAGNLVFETQAAGGTVQWNTLNFSGNPVASGTYLIFISSKNTTETNVKKVVIIR